VKIAYVCTNYNNSQLTIQALQSLHQGGGHACLSVVVDNQSTPENRATLKAFADGREDVEVIWSPDNVGYFRGLNLGLRRAKQAMPDLDFMIVGNNDLLFPPEFMAQLEGVKGRSDSHPVLSPDIVTLDHQHQNPHVIKGISRVRELVYDLYHAHYLLASLILKAAQWSRALTDRTDEQSWRVPQFIHQGYGACYILTPRFWDYFEELWAPTFLMGEEYFLSKQLRDVDQDVYYEPSVVVHHVCHATMSQVPSRLMWEYSRQAHRIRRQFVKSI